MTDAEAPADRSGTSTGTGTGDDPSMADRLTDLECWLAHLERVTQELSEVIARQDRTIDGLTRQVRILGERLRAVEATLPDPQTPSDGKPPPHY